MYIPLECCLPTGNIWLCFFTTDVPPGGSCKTVNSSEECGIGGICRDVATEGASQQLNCTCKNGYNVTTILPGMQSCQPGWRTNLELAIIKERAVIRHLLVIVTGIRTQLSSENTERQKKDRMSRLTWQWLT